MSDTPSFEQLVDLAEGRLAEPERARLLAQLAGDPAAADTAEWVTSVIALMRSDDSEDAPDHVINRAIRLLRPAPDAAPGLLRRIAAALRFDSAAAPLAMGMRSDQEAPRQLLFEAEDRDLDVRIAAGAGQFRISGQILGPDEGGSVELIGAKLTVRVGLNLLSEFTLPPVPPGRYRLVLRQGDREVETAPFELA